MWNYPIIDLHATWLAVNPIQGCPNRCKYCFLNGVGLTGKKPEEIVSPIEAIEILKNSKFYTRDIPICIESQTDAFATPSNIKFVIELLKEMDKKDIKNTKIFITKCKIPDYFIEEIKKYRDKGHKFIFFMSYSGLDSNIEVGINKENIKQNFINLYKEKFDIIHYWRPFVPQNSTKEKILEVYNFVKKYSKCSVAIGLKVQENFFDNVTEFWPELKECDGVLTAEGIWHKEAYELIYSTDSIIGGYEHPIYQTTSCALAYVLKEEDRNSFYNKEECKCNKCPNTQREICKKYYKKDDKITKKDVYDLLKKLDINYNDNEIEISIDKKKKRIEIKNVEMSMKEFTFLTQMTKHKVYSNKDKKDYYWNTSVNNADQIFI